jgi:hypothetical protein
LKLSLRDSTLVYDTKVLDWDGKKLDVVAVVICPWFMARLASEPEIWGIIVFFNLNASPIWRSHMNRISFCSSTL